MNPICTCLGFLEDDHTTVWDSYACFLLFWHHLETSGLLDDNQKAKLEIQLMHRWKRICNPVHALALQCDPSCSKMCENIVNTHGNIFIE